MTMFQMLTNTIQIKWGRKLLAVLTASSLATVGALAQTTAPAQPEPQLQEVVVTGSRIPVPANISATSPTTVMSSQEMQLQGHTDITDVINQLPQNIISSANDFGNTSSPLTSTGGFSTVDLRGMGPQRTLVLVNGRRLGAGDPSTSNQATAPDIDQIPVPLIERVDVVTGGASATYGSDAIAGVVNFILKKDFQGIQIDGQYGLSQHDQHDSYVEGLLGHDDPDTGYTANPPPTGSMRDGYKHDLSMVMGTNFADDKGNITGYFVYHDQQPVSASARDFSACQLYSNAVFAIEDLYRASSATAARTPTNSARKPASSGSTVHATRWWATNSCPGRRPARARRGSTITTNSNICSAKTSAIRRDSSGTTISMITSSRTWNLAGWTIEPMAVVAPSGLFHWGEYPNSGRQRAHQLQQPAAERAAAIDHLHPGADRGRLGQPRAPRAIARTWRSAGATSRAEGGSRFYEHNNFRLWSVPTATSSTAGTMICTHRTTM